ncbi:MAG: hypothetical protein BWY73_01150 [candidate division TA06 bacterium ADurb.Bin417]|uniref:Uncharacterized protein n=1 Tax=candidate division TA06 bacterium ADurb.Bin417 TaxID=1852828 RepID=A0A1V5MDA3_UNCT6|nr:MAG: hypothetical protein BWY73_01150 [candidate division TA06 bacterium ADurb.Bin417]
MNGWLGQLSPYLGINQDGTATDIWNRMKVHKLVICPSPRTAYRIYGINYRGWAGGLVTTNKLENLGLSLDKFIYVGEVRTSSTYSLSNSERPVDYERHYGQANFLFADGHVESGNTDQFGPYYISTAGSPFAVYWTGR